MRSGKQPPEVSELSWWRALQEFRRNPLALLERVPPGQPVTQLTIGRQRTWVVDEPELIQDILVTRAPLFRKSRILQKAKRFLGEGLLTSEGEFHKRERRLVQPAFHRDRLAGYAQTMAALAERHCDRWQDGQTVEVSAAMMRLTLAIVAQTLFSADVEGEAAEVGTAMTDLVGMFSVYMLPFADWVEKLPLPLAFRLRRARQTMDRIVYGFIEERRRSGEDRGDLLSMLLKASDGEGGTGCLSDEQVRDEVMTLFVAGHETTANALTWTWLLLSQHPDVELRVAQEVGQVLGRRRPSFEDLPQLRFTEQVLAESMRLYPPAWAIGRMARVEVTVGGYTAPPGTVFLISPYRLHRQERFFPDPERFDPDRFLPERRDGRPRFCYLPFGAGPRICIGERFAWMEGVLVLATYVQRWRLRLAGPAPGLLPQITLRPAGPLWMRAEAQECVTKTERSAALGVR